MLGVKTIWNGSVMNLRKNKGVEILKEELINNPSDPISELAEEFGVTKEIMEKRFEGSSHKCEL